MTASWTEIGDRVFVRRYKFYDQNIVAILGRDETLVVDTRISHGHSDHALGNHVFRPCAIWGHARCPEFMRAGAELARAWVTANMPEMAAEMPEIVIDPPDRTFDQT